MNAEPMWRIVDGKKMVPEGSSRMELEKHVEDLVESDPSCLGKPLLIIGRQGGSITENGGPDLLALNAAGGTVMIELKRGESDRETVGQVLEYQSWVEILSTDEILAMFARYRPGVDLADAFFERFGRRLPQVLNVSLTVTIVAAAVGPKTELSIRSLQRKGLPLTLVGYRYYPGLSAIQFVPLLEADQDGDVDAESGEPRRGRPASAGEIARLHASLDRVEARLEELRPTLKALRRPPSAATTYPPMADLEGIDPNILYFWLTYARRFAWDFVPFSFLYELYKHWLRSQAAEGLAQVELDAPIFGRRLAVAATATGEWIREKRRPENLMDAPEPLMELVPSWKRPQGNLPVHGYLRSGVVDHRGDADQA